MEKIVLLRLERENHATAVTYYKDMTYRCDHWDEGDYSEWFIEDDIFWFKHAGYTTFETSPIDKEDPERRNAVRKLNEVLLRELFEENILKS